MPYPTHKSSSPLFWQAFPTMGKKHMVWNIPVLIEMMFLNVSQSFHSFSSNFGRNCQNNIDASITGSCVGIEVAAIIVLLALLCPQHGQVWWILYAGFIWSWIIAYNMSWPKEEMSLQTSELFLFLCSCEYWVQEFANGLHWVLLHHRNQNILTLKH